MKQKKEINIKEALEILRDEKDVIVTTEYGIRLFLSEHCLRLIYLNNGDERCYKVSAHDSYGGFFVEYDTISVGDKFTHNGEKFVLIKSYPHCGLLNTSTYETERVFIVPKDMHNISHREWLKITCNRKFDRI